MPPATGPDVTVVLGVNDQDEVTVIRLNKPRPNLRSMVCVHGVPCSDVIRGKKRIAGSLKCVPQARLCDRTQPL